MFYPEAHVFIMGMRLGLQGFEDPFNRRFFPWDNINYELLDYYKQLTALKERYLPLRLGDIKVLNSVNGYLQIKRTWEKDTIYAACNNDMKSYEIENVSEILLSENCSFSTNNKIYLFEGSFILYK